MRSRSVIGNFGASLQTLVGGNITIYTELCERARGEAWQLLLEHASQAGANNHIVRTRHSNRDLMEHKSPKRRTIACA